MQYVSDLYTIKDIAVNKTIYKQWNDIKTISARSSKQKISHGTQLISPVQVISFYVTEVNIKINNFQSTLKIKKIGIMFTTMITDP